MKRRKRYGMIVLGFAGIISVAGCLLLSAQMTFTERFGDGEGNADKTVHMYSLDLNENEDYRDNRDKLKSVEAFGFEVVITNLTGSQANGEGYISFTDLGAPTVAEVRQQATRIFSGAELPLGVGETRTIDFDESQGYIENFHAIAEAVKLGYFYFYGVTDVGTAVTYADLILVMTVTVEI